MSRIRNIRPEFWKNEQILNCSISARLGFIGLWNFCDDNGIHPASYITLKIELFPTDSDIEISTIKEMVGEWIRNDLLIEYEHHKKKYWMVTGFLRHQLTQKPNIKYPLPKNFLDYYPDLDEKLKLRLVNLS